jgi:probable HAF family extracellular repeat protein
MERKFTFRLLELFLGLSFVSSVSSVSAEVRYTVTDLGTMGWGYSFAYDINNKGQIVGALRNSYGGISTAFLWENGVMKDLELSWSSAYSINDNGQICGIAIIDGTRQGFLWDTNEVTGLGTLGGYSGSNCINNSNQIVGYSESETGSFYDRAFLWDNGNMQNLGTFGTDATAKSINDSGVIVGYSCDSSLNNYAFVYENGEMKKLDTPIGKTSGASSINDNGQIAGETSSGSLMQACLWQDGKRSDLELLTGYNISCAYDINNVGNIVGAVGCPGKIHAALWEDGNVVDLNDLISSSSGWELEFAEAINDSGQIVGFGNINGETHAFLLTSIPEPTSLMFLFFAGFMGKGILIQSRKES